MKNKKLRKEIILFIVFLFFGLFLLPFLIYFIGYMVFGDYAGGGFTDLYKDLYIRISHVDLVAWFIFLSPYLIWISLRQTLSLYRKRKNYRDKNTTVN